MYKLVIIRHGESLWNLENKFTGWTDVELTSRGEEEAKKAGKILKLNGFSFDIAYTSKLIRAIKTLNLCLSEMKLQRISIHKSWRLNERHYGALQGLNKLETVRKFGEKQVAIWRRSYDIPPPQNYNNSIEDGITAPSSESLKDVKSRFMPLWENEISRKILTNEKVLVVAHGNSLRALIKHVGNISKENIAKVNIPTGIPFIIELDKQLNIEKSYYLGDKEMIDKKINSVKNQISLQ